MISKELLSEVLKVYIESISSPKEFDYHEIIYRRDGTNRYINIHELAYKCKEWARLKELTLFSGAIENSDNEFDLEWSYDCQIFSHKDGIELFYIKCESEPEAIFKACQCILDNKEDKHGRSK